MLYAITFHHLKTSYSNFEKLKFSFQDEFYREIPLKNAVLLQSGTRIEIYSTSKDAGRILFDFFSEKSGFSDEKLKKLFSVTKGREAAEHLFSLTSKIESRVLGETYLPWLVKSSLNRANKYRKAEELREIFEGALEAYERAKMETEIEGSHAPVNMAIELLENRNIKKAVLLGAGLSGIRLARALDGDIYISYRDKDIASYAAEETNGKIIDYSDRKEVISHSDLLICATLASHFRVTPALVDSASSLIVVDLSPFSNVSPEVATIEGITLLNTALRDTIMENYNLMKGAVPEVKKIIEEELEKYRLQ